jgi:hypothetical protein
MKNDPGRWQHPIATPTVDLHAYTPWFDGVSEASPNVLPATQPASVTTPSSLPELQASGNAACALLGKLYVSSLLSAMTWSTRPARCFNGQATTSDLVWTNLVCCPPGGVYTGPSALTLARNRNRESRRGQMMRDQTQAQFDTIAQQAGLTTGK